MLVMEYARHGALLNQSQLTASELASSMSQTLDAMDYLQKKGITHRDIKPENILVTSKTPLTVKLADFDLHGNGDLMSTFCGSPLFNSPEMWNAGLHCVPYTKAIDVWAIGVIILGYAFFYGLPSTPEVPSISDIRHRRPSVLEPWWRWSRALTSASSPIRPGWELLVQYARRILRDCPSAASCKPEMLHFVGLEIPSLADNLRFLRSLDSAPLSLAFVHLDIDEALPITLNFPRLCQALNVPADAITDGHEQTDERRSVTGGSDGRVSREYVSLDYAIEFLRRQNEEAQIEASKISEVQMRLRTAHLASWPKDAADSGRFSNLRCYGHLELMERHRA